MGNVLVKEETLTEIAESIREKTGSKIILEDRRGQNSYSKGKIRYGGQ